jgi:cellulose synthase/poly-beta-1,6-N-acetylglucosamine synthase-like glycosyltransferase
VAFTTHLVSNDSLQGDVKKRNHILNLKAQNTFILALDGDVDFKPDAVIRLLDRMKKNNDVGAACGRIIPMGGGNFSFKSKHFGFYMKFSNNVIVAAQKKNMLYLQMTEVSLGLADNLHVYPLIWHLRHISLELEGYRTYKSSHGL